MSSFIAEDLICYLWQWQDQILNKNTGGIFHVRARKPFLWGFMCSDHRTGICACCSYLNGAGEVESVMIPIMDISEVKWSEQQSLSRTKEIEASEKTPSKR
ncbi:hypothetical protein F4779DRAFT_593206 [Xylariaceae sp. FL0662B]|nr:hypothetical protein F4779DRAFT_593206 [Xylariaceae sp. FL0662B]